MFVYFSVQKYVMIWTNLKYTELNPLNLQGMFDDGFTPGTEPAPLSRPEIGKHCVATRHGF
jgi:hypothetical protein